MDEQHGNVVSQPQWDELHRILGSFVYTVAYPEQKRRSAFPLPCGAGKTTTVRGYCKASYELGRSYKIVICAEKIEALCELKRDLVNEDGIPNSLISLLHSYDHDPDFNIENPKPGTASEPSDSDDLDDLKQIVLLSHSKLHQGYNKMPYDLLIYDESLVLGQGSTIPIANLLGEIGKFTGTVKGRERNATQHQKMLAAWFDSVENILFNASNDDLLKFPPLPITVAEARKADKAIHGNDDFLKNFIGLAYDGHDMRLMKERVQGSSIITVNQTIPDDMNNIAILDASYSIRKLMAYDDTIEEVSLFQNIKDHSDVTIHFAKAKAGRRSIMAGLQRGGDTNLFHEVAELTAGHETALNRYGDCDAVVFAGLLTLPHDAVAARVFAHSRDIKRELSSEELVKVVQSERVHSLYQALSRGSCRIMNNGKALKMDAYVFFNDYRNIKEALGVAMPSVKFAEYPTKHIKNKTTKKDECKIVFTKVLSEHGRNTISIKELNAHAPNVSSDTKEDALSELLGDIVGFDWQRQKRSLIRLGVN